MKLIKSLRRKFQQLGFDKQCGRAKKIIIGAGGLEYQYPGWFATEQHKLDVTKRETFLRYWKPCSRTAFLAEHVWEHIPQDERSNANRNCYEFLAPKGWLRIAVPDGLHPDPLYIESTRQGGNGAGSEDHKVLFDYRSLTSELEEAGFRVRLLEYWDENGEFHHHNWDPEAGYIERSIRYDSRNSDGRPNYTSLIIDALKPE